MDNACYSDFLMPLNVIQNSSRNLISRTIAIAAGKGGVGKSTVASQLACGLANANLKVGILDADFYGPSIRKLIPANQNAQTLSSIHQPAISGKLKSLSYADFKEGAVSSSLRAPLANQLVNEFIHKTAWGELDYLLIDCPPGTGDIHMSLCQNHTIDFAIIVTTPQELALLDVRRTIRFFQKMNVKILGIVENMSYFERGGERIPLFGKGGGKKLSDEFKIPLIAELPFEPKLGELIDKGFHLFETKDPQLEESKRAFQSVIKSVMTMSESESYTFDVIDPEHFSISFNRNEKRVYNLKDLQANCPCANCHINRPSPSNKVLAKGIRKVGLYAIQIDFIEGCTKGIYPFSYLKTLGEAKC